MLGTIEAVRKNHLGRHGILSGASEATEGLDSRVGCSDRLPRIQKRAKLSEKHLADIRPRLGRFVATFGSKPIRSIVAAEIETWLHDLTLSPQSINNYRSIVGAFFEYALKRELVEKNPVAGIDKVKLIDKAAEIFTPKQLAGLLAAAHPSLLPALALQAFAGLRTAEVLRLEWSDVDLVGGFVTVGAHKSKTARRRLIPIAPNLAEWLRPYAQMSGPVYGTKTRNYHADIDALRSSIDLAAWPNNGLRHSFASYHLAKHQDAAALMPQMGHTTTRQIFETYREFVRPEEAEKYWNIRPSRNRRPAALIKKQRINIPCDTIDRVFLEIA
jgi:integrase